MSRATYHQKVLDRWRTKYPDTTKVFFVGSAAHALACCPYCEQNHDVCLVELNRRHRRWSIYTCQKCAEILKAHPSLIAGDQTLKHLLTKHIKSATNLGVDLHQVVSFLFLRLTQRRSQHLRKISKNECTLSVFDLPVIPKYCPVFPWILLQLGWVVTKPKKKKKEWADNCLVSLDRIDSRLGYVPANVAWISLRANMIKRDATKDELIALGRYAQQLAGGLEDQGAQI